PAFESALNVGTKLIECDIQEVNGEFYVFHDHTLERLFDINGRFTEQNNSEIEKLLLPNNEPVPTLAQLCECIGTKATLNLEIKHLINISAFVAELNKLRAQYSVNVVLSSFSHPLLMKVRTLMRGSRDYHDIKYAALIAHLPADLALYAHKLGVEIAAVDAFMVTRAFVEHAHSLCIDVWCYTVNDEWLLSKLYDYGVDAIFTDKPAWALDVMTSTNSAGAVTR
ncbi:MAG: glycerophosphodiester phosphodiesterase, partial [Pseudomonadota bacterium]